MKVGELISELRRFSRELDVYKINPDGTLSECEELFRIQAYWYGPGKPIPSEDWRVDHSRMRSDNYPNAVAL